MRSSTAVDAFRIRPQICRLVSGCQVSTFSVNLFNKHLIRPIVLDSTPPGVPPAAVDLWLPAPGRLSPDAAAKNVSVLCDELVHE